MKRAAISRRGGGHGWQLILADLALILFLLTLSALPAAEAETRQRLADTKARPRDIQPKIDAEIAASQALYRPVAEGPSLGEWLQSQPRDHRATLTIFVTHTQGGEAAAWQRAQVLSDEARSSGTRVRAIITTGPDSDVYASLAYDAVGERGKM